MFNTDKNKEIWKSIKLDNISYSYSVSNMGRVRNNITNKILKPFHARGYLVIKLCKNKVEKSVYIHRLVALNFVKGKTDIKNEVDHIDGDKTNNKWYNLEWVDRSEQIIRAFKLGLIKPKRGVDIASSKYDEITINKICSLLELGYSRIDTSYNVFGDRSSNHLDLIDKIKGGHSWTHISSKYNIPKTKSNKKYTENQINDICKMIESGLSDNDIIDKLDLDSSRIQLKSLLYDIRHKRKWTNISCDYNFGKGSTTIENNDDYYTIEIH